MAIAEGCLHYLLYLYEKLPLIKDLVDQHPLSRIGDVALPLYYAASIGLLQVIENIMPQIIDVNAQGGYYGNALQAASEGGQEKVVQILLNAGADVNAQGGLYGNALQAASERGHEKVVEILLNAGADVKAEGGNHVRKIGHALSVDATTKHVEE
ncbi:MAG: hypothetical protein Q9191_008026 [Dirinaria sp. TL-2023a]